MRQNELFGLVNSERNMFQELMAVCCIVYVQEFR